MREAGRPDREPGQGAGGGSPWRHPRHHRARAHPLATHGARRPDRNGATGLGRRGRGRGHPQRDHENFAPLRAELRRRVSSCAARPTRGGLAPAGGPRCPRRRRPGRGAAVVSRRLHGALPWSRCTATGPTGWSPPAQLAVVVGVGAGRLRGQRRRRVSWRTPGRRSSSAGPGRRDSGGRLHRDRLRRRAAQVKPFRVDWDLAAAEKGGHPYFCSRRSRSSRPRRSHPLGRLVEDRFVLDEQRLAARSCGDVERSSSSPAARRTTRPDREVPIEHWTRAGRGREASEFPLPGPRAGPDTRGWWRSRRAAIRPTRWRPSGTPGAEGRVLGRSATPTARRSRGSPTGCSTPGRPRDRRRRDQDLLTRSSPPARGARARPARGTKYGDEVARGVRGAGGDAALIGEVLSVVEPVREWPGQSPRRRRCSSPAGTSATRCPGGRAQAQGAGVQARRGLRRGAQARADRADRGRAAVVVVMPSPRGGRVLHSKLLSNIQEVRARGARTVVVAEAGDERSGRTRHPDRGAGAAARAQPPGDGGAAEVLAAGSRRPAATTSTSRATWPSPSPSSRATGAVPHRAWYTVGAVIRRGPRGRPGRPRRSGKPPGRRRAEPRGTRSNPGPAAFRPFEGCQAASP